MQPDTHPLDHQALLKEADALLDSIRSGQGTLPQMPQEKSTGLAGPFS